MIHTLRSRRGLGMAEFVRQSLLQVPHERWPREETAAEPVATARVDWGRWLVDCPFCAGACLADFDDPRSFCLSCHNERAGHRWVGVKLPTARQRTAVEAALAELPEGEQHWRPGQPVASLAPAPQQEVPMDPELAQQLAQLAGEDRDRQAALVETYRAALEEERRGAWRLIHEIESLRWRQGLG